MRKLTDEEREEAKRKLVERVVEAIEQSPRGLTKGEIRGALLEAASKAGLLS